MDYFWLKMGAIVLVLVAPLIIALLYDEFGQPRSRYRWWPDE